MEITVFKNREEAGQLLAKKLITYAKHKDAVVLAIPRGGVVVGVQIADKLSLPLSIIVVKKLGAPGNPELAVGAIASGGVRYIDFDLALRTGVEQEYLDEELKRKKKEVDERTKKFSPSADGLELRIKNKRTIILVDDGIATGATVFAAVKYLQEIQNYKIILAAPVIAKDTFNKLKSEVSDIITLDIPDSFNAVGQFYKDFPQVSDDTVIKLLSK